MKKYRIVQYGPITFAVQARTLFIWYNLFERRSFSADGITTHKVYYNDASSAFKALKEVIKSRDEALKQKKRFPRLINSWSEKEIKISTDII